MTFEPARRRRPQDRNTREPLEWGVVYRAAVLTIAASVVTGLACGVLARFLGAKLGKQTLDALLQAKWPYVIGFLIGLIPIAIGSIYLSDRLERDEMRHCAILGVIDLTLLLLFTGGFTRSPISFWDVIYYLSVIPTAAAIGRWYESERS